ncbi:MAG TPA: dynamin family protein, partial [Syntrophobacteraceae bacterium]|nr:dynamin family protein [Syntrophobacteraceae bacterium]
MSVVAEPVSRPLEGIGDFKYLRDRLLAVIEQMLDLGLSDRGSCLEFKEKLETNTFNLVALGEFKRGKTCLLNALLGEEILPVSVVPLTSIVTILAYGESLSARVFFKNGKAADIPVESLSDYITETGNPRNGRGVFEAVVFYPSPYLKDGVRLVDTPGVGSVFTHNTDVAYRYLPKSDAALFLLSVDQPVSNAEIDFLKDVRQYAGRIFFLLNKTDYLAAEEVDSALLFAKQTLESIMGRRRAEDEEPKTEDGGGKTEDIRIFPISAKLGLRAKLDGSPEDLAASGLPCFSEALHRFLVSEKGKVLLDTVSANLLKLLSHLRLETELELKALGTPVDSIRKKIAAFESRKQELLEQRRTFDVLLNAEIERLIIRSLDRGLIELKAKLASELEQQFDRFYESNKDLALKDLNDALEGFVLEKIQAQFSAWRELEDERISTLFDSICGRFASEINGVTDSLLDFSSRLFSVPFEAVEAESLRTTGSSFHYKLRGDAVGL